mmetsp:Transcript_28827/g.81217  ORF Transcript_28827/g.81217 Transcript_28827/m.81217 type:complete len:155 (+) Transcript_28827:197-661(+)
MGLLIDTQSKTVARKLAVFLLIFYASYYTVSVVLVASFGADWGQLGLYPFEHAFSLFNPASGGDSLGRWLAMCINYTVALAVNFFYLKSSRLTWDYACSTSIFHLILSCIATLSFPTNWIWWVTLILLTLLLWIVGQLTVYKLHDLRDIRLDNE